MPTLFKKNAGIAENNEASGVSLKKSNLLNDETKDGSNMHTTELTQDQNQTETSSSRNLAEEKSFIAISAEVDQQLEEDAKPLIDKIEKFLSTLSAKDKMEYANDILQELRGLRFDPTCDTLHDPAVYKRVTNKIELYADPKFVHKWRTTFELHTESDEAYALPKIFPTFPKIIQKKAVENTEDVITNLDSTNTNSLRPK